MSFFEFSDARHSVGHGKSHAECCSTGLLSCRPCPGCRAPSEDGRRVALEHRDVAVEADLRPSRRPGDESRKATPAAQMETHRQGGTT